jgi:penicillin-binding protein 1A
MSARSAVRAQAPAAASPFCPYCGGHDLGGLDWTDSPGRGRLRRYVRRVRRFLAMVLALTLLGAVMLGGLLLVTPSVANAPQLTRALARAHHAAYPGPPVPRRFAASLVATEDHRFYSEVGVDPFALARVALGRLTGQPDQGGSTLYQQLARMLYAPGGSVLPAKAEQVALGVKLAIGYSRAEILRMYASVAYFGEGHYGLAAASCGYFGVAPAALSWPQAALLAGLMQAPSAYDPVTHFTRARAREEHVFARLTATRTLTQAQADRAYREPLHLIGGARIVARCS